MPTINVKHAMLQLAKKIANTEYKDRFEVIRDSQFTIIGHMNIPATEVRNEEIRNILDQHPEFDAGTFRTMIKEIQVRNKQEGNK